MLVIIIIGLVLAVIFVAAIVLSKRRQAISYERGVKMAPMLIHLPPTTDDINGGGRDERDVTNEALSQAQVMYSIISSTLTKGMSSRIYGQQHISFEIIAAGGLIKYYAVVPLAMTETVKQAIISAYPSARLEETEPDSIFSEDASVTKIAGGEMRLKNDFVLPISTYEDGKRDASLAMLNAMSGTKEGEGLALQVIFRPTDGSWTEKSDEWKKDLRAGKDRKSARTNFAFGLGNLIKDLAVAFWHPPEAHEKDEQNSDLNQDEISAIDKKTKYPGFETLIRVVASANTKPRSEALVNLLVAAFTQFDLQGINGLEYYEIKDTKKLSVDYVFRMFPQGQKQDILNSVELASIFHLPSQNAIPTSQVERQATKQVEAPAKVPETGVILGENQFRGVSKEIRLTENDRRRHTYVIGSTGMGKSVLLTNVAYQDMVDGRGFAFIDPHGDAVELLMSKVPEDRVDDIIYFDPADMEHPVGMNMFEWTTEDQKDFIVQEGINMLQSLFDPNNQGFFGPRGQHMFRNAALLLMSDPNGATFIDIPQCFTDPEFVKQKLQYVTDKAVYDYWTKEFPASQKSNDAGEVITWFTSKWGPFLSNLTMRNILGQVKSGFNIREIMDNKKIFLVNLSKGRLGDINSQLLGMILVMKFQAAAMSRADIPEHERKDFCLFVDEFQNFATESFESILSEARKYRLNLFLANQFMTQLTDKIREGILGNVGTIMSGRLGVTDAELMEKAFTPVFKAEDLHKQGNYQAIATVMMNNLPSSPFTMALLPPMGEANPELLETMKAYSAAKYGRTREEVEAEIRARWKTVKKDEQKLTGAKEVGPIGELEKVQSEKVSEKESFLSAWKKKREEKRAEAGNNNGGSVDGVNSAARGSGESQGEERHKNDSDDKDNKDEPGDSAGGSASGSRTDRDDEMTFKVERKRKPKITLG